MNLAEAYSGVDKVSLQCYVAQSIAVAGIGIGIGIGVGIGVENAGTQLRYRLPEHVRTSNVQRNYAMIPLLTSLHQRLAHAR